MGLDELIKTLDSDDFEILKKKNFQMNGSIAIKN